MLIENLNIRLFFIVFVLLLACFYTLPNIFPEHKAWYFSEDKVTLGLDIQGGLHLVMGVDIDGVVKEETSRLISTFQEDLKKENITFEDITVIKGNKGRFELKFKDNNNKEKFDSYFEKQNYNTILQVLSSEDKRVEVRFYDHYLQNYHEKVIDQTIETLRNRIDEFGVAEPVITSQGSDRILIQLPGIKDAESAKRLINSTAKLDFMIVSDEITNEELLNIIAEAEEKGEYNLNKLNYTQYIKRLNEDLKEKLPKDHVIYFEKRSNVKTLSDGKNPYLLKTTTLGGDDLKNAFVDIDPQFGTPYVSLRFNPVGSKKFADITEKNVKKLMAIVLDKIVKSAPLIKTKISGGSAQIELGTSRNQQEIMDEAKMIATSLRAGSLPAALTQLEERSVGPTLGADSIRKGTKAGIIGGILVLIFMLIYYRAFGLVANMALILNIILLIAVLSSLGATLTLPGVAGIALTVGMAVDANVIIYERIKEELRRGTGLLLSLREGYSKAFSAIFDANITTAAVCIVLMYYGSGPVRGFAVTLLIGIFTSMFTAIFFTRTVFEYLLVKLNWKKISI